MWLWLCTKVGLVPILCRFVVFVVCFALDVAVLHQPPTWPVLVVQLHCNWCTSCASHLQLQIVQASTIAAIVVEAVLLLCTDDQSTRLGQVPDSIPCLVGQVVEPARQLLGRVPRYAASDVHRSHPDVVARAGPCGCLLCRRREHRQQAARSTSAGAPALLDGDDVAVTLRLQQHIVRLLTEEREPRPHLIRHRDASDANGGPLARDECNRGGSHFKWVLSEIRQKMGEWTCARQG